MNWLLNVKVGSKDRFHNWLIAEVGFETYTKNRLWDDNSLLNYITVLRCDNLYRKFLDHENKVTIIDFSKKR